MKQPWARTALFAIFAASGFAGLIYESIWAHYLKLFLGHAAYAQTLVLAIFMGGMAVGSWISSRLSPRWPNLFIAYAVAEAAIGVLALVFHEMFVASTGLAYETVLPRLGGSAAAVYAFKWGLSALLVFPQSVLLGMTFPLMTAGVLRAFADRPGRSVAILYFTNSLGAAVGVLVSGFLLVPATGLPGALRIAGMINLVVAAAAWWVSPPAQATPVLAQPKMRRDRTVVFLLLAALITGATSFLYEVGWMRMLALVLGSSTHAFELMLSAFILGLALGGLWIQRRIDRLSLPLRTLGYLQLAMGGCAVATLLAYAQAFKAMQWLVLHLPRSDAGYTLFNLSSNSIALAIMLPATFCAGTTLPLLTFYLIKRGHGEASVGQVYAANTVGAIAGVFFAVHLGIPLLGVKHLLSLGGAIDALLGIILLWKAGGFARPRIVFALTAAGALAMAGPIFLLRLDPRQLASGVYRFGELASAIGKVLYYRDGKTATVSIASIGEPPILTLRTNGKTDAALSLGPDPHPDESTMILLGAVALGLHPNARNVACIGFGSGLTTHTLLGNPRVSRVDTIEIEPEMIRAAASFRPRNERAYVDPRSRIVIDDAKSYFSTRPEKYDLILSEPSNPWVSGVAGLFSAEFYGHLRRYLAPGGIFIQWLQLYEIDVPLVISVLKAMEANFGDYVVYAANDTDVFIAAKSDGTFGALDRSALVEPAVAQELARVGIRYMDDLELRRVGTRSSWEGLTRMSTVPANTDYRPVLDQGAVRARFLQANARSLVVFETELFPTVELLSRVPLAHELSAVTLTPYFRGSQRAAEALWLRDAVLGRADIANTPVVSQELKDQARTVTEWLQHCDQQPVPLGSLLRVIQAVLAHLSPGDLDEIWYAIASRGCGRQFSEQDRQWVAFLRAVGQRDGGRMAAASRQLLAAEPDLSTSSKRYLVAGGMLGSIAEGQPAAAQALWSQYADTLGQKDDLLLGMLVARSGGSAK
jgi:predicted membrane-bound spermidine synthase